MDGYRLDLSAPPDWHPLEQLQRLCARHPGWPAVHAAEFMYCGQLVGASVRTIVVYKDRRTRAYLCLDPCGHAYVVSGARNLLEAHMEPLSRALRRF